MSPYIGYFKITSAIKQGYPVLQQIFVFVNDCLELQTGAHQISKTDERKMYTLKNHLRNYLQV